MSISKTAPVFLWLGGVLAGLHSTLSPAVTLTELEGRVRPALSQTNAAWVAAQGKTAASAATVDVNALLASARTAVKSGNPALIEPSAQVLVMLVLADVEKAATADANARKGAIDRANQARRSVRDLLAEVARDGRMKAIAEAIATMEEDLDDISRQLSIALQRAAQKQAQSAQALSTLLAKQTSVAEAIIANLRG